MAQRTTNVTLNKAVKQAGKISITELQDAIDAQKPIPAAVTELVAAVLAAGIRARASSIHIEPGPDGVRLRQRIDGILTEIDKLPLPIGPILVAGLKALVHVPASEQTLPQQATMTVIVQEKPYKLQVVTIPVEGGEKAVVQITRVGAAAPTLSELGYFGPNLKAVSAAMTKAKGLILLAGPHDAGQAESAYSMLSQLSSPGVSIATIEDPILYLVPGATQTQVNVRAGLGFATGLRALLRQDANVLLVSNLRDGETARLAIEGALTGRLVVAGLHAANATSALGYLLSAGIEPYLAAHTLEAVVGQRQVRRLCEHCKEIFSPAEPEMIGLLKSLGIKTAAQLERVRQLERQALAEKLVAGASPADDSSFITKLYRPSKNGCTQCSHTGYQGTIGIHEVLPSSDNLQQLLVGHATAQVIQDQAVQDGMPTMQMDGLVKVLLGLTSVEEVASATQS